MTAQDRKYHNDSRHLLAQGRQELAIGDLRQASEKGWGAAAQIVKAIAQQRGWEHDGHGLIHQAVRQLRRETGDRNIRGWFSTANSLHTNFYEDTWDHEDVNDGLDEVEQFINRLERLLE